MLCLFLRSRCDVGGIGKKGEIQEVYLPGLFRGTNGMWLWGLLGMRREDERPQDTLSTGLQRRACFLFGRYRLEIAVVP